MRRTPCFMTAIDTVHNFTALKRIARSRLRWQYSWDRFRWPSGTRWQCGGCSGSGDGCHRRGQPPGPLPSPLDRPFRAACELRIPFGHSRIAISAIKAPRTHENGTRIGRFRLQTVPPPKACSASERSDSLPASVAHTDAGWRNLRQPPGAVSSDGQRLQMGG